MNKQDARLLNPITQNYLRQQAIRLREQGKRIGDRAVYLGVHRTTVSGWWRQYQQEGSAALKQQSRGAKLGEGRKLKPTEEAKVQRLIRKHFPDELNIDSALWTRSAVQTLIADECGVEMPIRTVGEYLKRWRCTPQKPLKRAYEQDPQAVKVWLETTYPAIEQRALQSDAEIAWADESGLRSDAQVGRGYAPIGQTPEIQPSTQRFSVNYIASISNQGCITLHALHPKVDRHPVHRSNAVQQWLHEHQANIEMHFLPPYSPQLNPAEYLNCDVSCMAFTPSHLPAT